MIVLDDERYGWVLLEEDGRLYLDLLCSHYVTNKTDWLFPDGQGGECWNVSF